MHKLISKVFLIGFFLVRPCLSDQEIYNPCKKIEDECRKAGFSIGLAAQGKGLGVNCISNLMGTPIAKKPSIPLPEISSDLVKECKKRNPEFGQAPTPHAHIDRVLWLTLIEEDLKRQFCDVPAIKECFKVSRNDCVKEIGPLVDQCGELFKSELPIDFDSTKQGPFFMKKISICINTKYLTRFQDRLIKSNPHCAFNKANPHPTTK